MSVRTDEPAGPEFPAKRQSVTNGWLLHIEEYVAQLQCRLRDRAKRIEEITGELVGARARNQQMELLLRATGMVLPIVSTILDSDPNDSEVIQAGVMDGVAVGVSYVFGELRVVIAVELMADGCTDLTIMATNSDREPLSPLRLSLGCDGSLPSGAEEGLRYLLRPRRRGRHY
jgi:hypothetical protein